MKKKYPNLSYLMYDYFNLKFTYEEKSPEDLIQKFTTTENIETIKNTLEEIDSFLRTKPTEKECHLWLSSLENNCAFRHYNFTALGWIKHLQSKILKAFQQRTAIIEDLKRKSEKFWANQKNIKPKKG
ncbi:hypothetical protein FAI41_03290 [Acetobacteraceae bacterium]|nr:hypothetical protein FAI41_03290 [Acetobacteraceae bacterium]